MTAVICLKVFELLARNDPQFYYADNDEGREAYMRDAKAYIDAMEQNFPEYFGLIPKADKDLQGALSHSANNRLAKRFTNHRQKDGS